MSESICYKPKDVCELLNISKTHCYELFLSESFPSFRVGKAHRIRKKDFEKWLEEQVKNK